MNRFHEVNKLHDGTMNVVHHFCFHTNIISNECFAFQQAIKQEDIMLFVEAKMMYNVHSTIMQFVYFMETIHDLLCVSRARIQCMMRHIKDNCEAEKSVQAKQHSSCSHTISNMCIFFLFGYFFVVDRVCKCAPINISHSRKNLIQGACAVHQQMQ